MYPYGLIGNCQVSALISEQGSIDWLCFPRPDSPPVFGKLLDPEGGCFSITPQGKFSSRQEYIPNTVILQTTLTDEDGNQCRIIDFCPRFTLHDRMHRPVSVFRILEPLKGNMSLTVLCQPVNGWAKTPVPAVRGNSHLRFDVGGESLRLTTSMPLTYLSEGQPFTLREPVYFALTWGMGIEEDLAEVMRRFLSKTTDYWNLWVKHCSIPTLYQKETIRSALTLKLHCYEDTGAILAALTTSLPEEVGHERNWDYRFCWLRDAYFVLSAFHQLGHFEEMEKFLKFLLEIGEKHEHSREVLHPVYRLDQTLPLPEIRHPEWAGWKGSLPVRSNNLAAEQIQNDVYGEMVLTLAPVFFDERFHHLRTSQHEDLLGHLGKLCADFVSKPDAGLWEIRGGLQEHTFSNFMCWAGLDRIHRIRELGFLRNLSWSPERSRDEARKALLKSLREGSLRNGPVDESFDAALLQVATLGFPDSEVVQSTVRQIQQQLRLGEDPLSSSFLYRYIRQDDFGKPAASFLICSFWLVSALVAIGENQQAKEVMDHSMKAANALGLFAEHFIPGSRVQTGNFPQAYSHVGQINAAFAVSPPWNQVL